MAGGGKGAFISAVHRVASRLDDHYELVAGALPSMPDKARRSGEALGLAAALRQRREGRRSGFVIVTTRGLRMAWHAECQSVSR
jgi:phytoene/squalene synthetase